MNRPPNPIVSVLIGLALSAGIAVGTYALYRLDPWADRGDHVSSPSTLDLKDQFAIEPALLHFHQAGAIPVPLDAPRAVAVGPGDRIFVAGDQTVLIFGSDGSRNTSIATVGEPTCLAIGHDQHATPGTVFVGAGRAIEVYSPTGDRLAVWQGLSDRTVLTSIAVAPNNIYAADAGERVLWIFDRQGEIVGQIGRVDPDREMPGFIIPSAYFDVAIGSNGVLHVVNPGARHIEEYLPDGTLEGFWGGAGTTIESFFGCCNPAHLAILPDGRFVTSEKGIPRIKIYDTFGEFDCVVAGPVELGIRDSATVDARLEKYTQVFDVAADSQGRILALDSFNKQVRIFTANQ